jgi:hypothetical protein
VVVVLALVLAFAGAVLSARLVTAPTAAVVHRHGAHRDGTAPSVRASFGSLSVVDVRTLPGLTPRALAGVTHFPSYLSQTAMRVQTVVVLTNALDSLARYDPQRFRLRAGSRTTRASGGSTPATVVQPGASLEARLEFVVPRSGSRLWLEFRDPARLPPIVIDLGRVRERAVKTVEAHVH